MNGDRPLAPDEIYEPYGAWPKTPLGMAAAFVFAAIWVAGYCWFTWQFFPPFRYVGLAIWTSIPAVGVAYSLILRHGRRTAWERGECVQATVIEKHVSLRTGRHRMTIEFDRDGGRQQLRLTVGSQTYFRKQVGQTCVAYVRPLSVKGLPFCLVAVIDPSKSD